MIGRYRWLTLVTIWLLSAALGAERLQEGDLIFHNSQSRQSKAIRQVTGSDLTHVGILVRARGQLMVAEASGAVQVTPVSDFIARGRGGKYLVKRLQGGLTPHQLKKMREVGLTFLGLPYDRLFLWDDASIYCSELVWKIYQRGAGIRLGEPQTFGSLDLSSSEAQMLLSERLGRRPVPNQEPIVTPVALARCSKLRVVLQR
mgnify:FL=1